MAKRPSLTKTLAEAAFYQAWFANTPEPGQDPEVYQRTLERYLNSFSKLPPLALKTIARASAAEANRSIEAYAFYFTPHWTIYKMRKAAINKDPDKLSVYIDFPELRKSLKANFNAVMANKISKISNGSPFEIMGAALATKFSERLVEIFVTPESLSKLMQGEKPSIKESKKSVKSSSSKKERDVDISASYESFNRFNFSIREKKSTAKPVDFILRREGILSWKLISIKLPMRKDEMIAKSKPKSTLASSSSGKTNDFNFRKAKWGMSKNEVLNSEKIIPTCNGCRKSRLYEDILEYSSKLLAKSVTVEYGFINGKLVASSYMLTEKHTNRNDYIYDFKQFKKALINKYGNPDKDKMRWKNDLYKDRPQDWGLAVGVGHLGYLCEWFEPKTIIRLYLDGGDFRVICGIWYESVSHQPEIQQFVEKRKAKEAEELM